MLHRYASFNRDSHLMGEYFDRITMFNSPGPISERLLWSKTRGADGRREIRACHSIFHTTDTRDWRDGPPAQLLQKH